MRTWVSKSRRVLYKARTPDEVTFVREQVTIGTGAAAQEVDFVYVHSPYEVVHVVGLDSDLRVALVEQYRHLLGRVLREVPAGSPKPGETLEEGARREFEEETGLEIAELRPLVKFYPSVGITDQVGHVFIGRVSGKKATRPSVGDRSRVEWESLASAAFQAGQGVFENGGTALSLVMAASALLDGPRGGTS